MSDYISHDHEHDGIDRRGFLQCMAWAGTGLLWTISGGVLVSKTLAQVAKAAEPLPATDLSFLQISDSHIGFSKEANKDVTETFKIALDRINAMPTPPSFLIHTGDISQLSKPEEFDTFDEVLKS
jgi:Icc protein